mmetsp:Transcript_20081/g.2708  ORF Transcript_20081/g.2708 Transcript_20081/m.2708 type:complete len:193 (-) Transcript_20081:26-604(-)
MMTSTTSMVTSTTSSVMSSTSARGHIETSPATMMTTSITRRHIKPSPTPMMATSTTRGHIEPTSTSTPRRHIKSFPFMMSSSPRRNIKASTTSSHSFSGRHIKSTSSYRWSIESTSSKASLGSFIESIIMIIIIKSSFITKSFHYNVIVINNFTSSKARFVESIIIVKIPIWVIVLLIVILCILRFTTASHF